MAADERDMEAADEVAGHQQHVAAQTERLGQCLAGGLRAAAAPLGGSNLFAVVEPDRQHHDQQG